MHELKTYVGVIDNMVFAVCTFSSLGTQIISMYILLYLTIMAQVMKICSIFHITQRFITVFTTVRLWSIS
jgi:hypothetical protein